MKRFRVYFTRASVFEEESMVVKAEDSQDAINKFQVEIGYNYDKIGKVKEIVNTAKLRDQAMRDLGLVKVKGNLGGTYWE